MATLPLFRPSLVPFAHFILGAKIATIKHQLLAAPHYAI